MRKQNMPEEAAAQTKRLGPKGKLLIGVLAVLLLTLVGIRLHSWTEQRGEARVIVLVNPWNGVDNTGFTPNLQTVESVQVDKSCAKALKQMLADCREAGCVPTLTAGYRSREEQLALFNHEVDRLMAAGLSADQAYSRAEETVGLPGTSEHELGLAVDLEDSAAQGWLRENAWRYGFILRYPEGSMEITGRIPDPAHFRYVGLAASEQIQTMGVTLEEYMGMFFTQQAEIIFE